MHPVAEGQETLASKLATALWTLGVGSIDQFAPFHRFASVSVTPFAT